MEKIRIIKRFCPKYYAIDLRYASFIYESNNLYYLKFPDLCMLFAKPIFYGKSGA